MNCTVLHILVFVFFEYEDLNCKKKESRRWNHWCSEECEKATEREYIVSKRKGKQYLYCLVRSNHPIVKDHNNKMECAGIM